MLAEPVSDEDLTARVRQLVPSQIETQPVSRSDRLFDVGHLSYLCSEFAIELVRLGR